MDSIDVAVDLMRAALWMALKLSLPLLVVGLMVGLGVSLFQALTQIQEQTLTFIPKILAVAVTLIVLLPTLLSWAVEYARESLDQLHRIWGRLSMSAILAQAMPVVTTDAAAGFLLVFFRMAGVTLSAPFVSTSFVPRKIRIGLAFLLALVCSPLAVPLTESGTLTALFGSPVSMLMAVGTEVVIGWSLGFVASVMAWGAQVAGQLVDQSIGFSLAEVMDPSSGPQAVTAHLFLTFGVLAFVLLQGHHLVVLAAHRSFEVAPPGVLAFGVAGGMVVVSDVGGEIWRLGLRIALPAMIVLVMVTTAMAVLARAVPEMNIFILGFAVRIVAGLLVIVLVLPFVAEVFRVAILGTDTLLRGFIERGGG